MEVSQKAKNRITILLSNSTPGYISEKNKNTNLKGYMYPTVHRNIIYTVDSSIIYNSQDMEST